MNIYFNHFIKNKIQNNLKTNKKKPDKINTVQSADMIQMNEQKIITDIYTSSMLHSGLKQRLYS